MRRMAQAVLVICGPVLASCAHPTTASRPQPDSDAQAIGANLGLTYRVLANRGEGGCKVPDSDRVTEGPCYEAVIELASARPLDLAGTAIYFSQVEPVDLVRPGDRGSISHVNGDLHRITLDRGAAAILPGAGRSLHFTVKGSALNRTKFMPNYYVVDAGGTAALIASTAERGTDAMGRKDMPFLAPLPEGARRAERDLSPLEDAGVTFTENARVAFDMDAVDSGIVPRPARLDMAPSRARLSLSAGFRPVIEGAAASALDAAFSRLASLGFREAATGVDLSVKVDRSAAIAAEGYRLNVAPDRIAILARDEAGAFYALQSLAALITPGRADIPALAITDAPRFAFRGMHIDIARNFHGPETLRALIDQMAAYKLNRLHLHLADDEGWRLEIEGLPELTEVGARRCHDPAEDRCLLPQLGSGPDTGSSGSGFLSAEDYVALLRYAAARHVEIIPALDMPGHARAAVKAMEARRRRLIASGAGEEEASRFLLSDPADTTVYRSIQHYSDNTMNVCRPSTYRFVAHVLDRVMALHEKAGVPLRRYHIGADETAGAWTGSPLCQAFLWRDDTPADAARLGGYFVARVAQMVAERGLVAGAWSDGLSHTDPEALPPRIQSNIWGTLYWDGAATAHDHANRGWDVVLSLPDVLYFDFPEAAHPEEGGYYWAARRAPARKLFAMMPGNLPAMAAYWKDRDEQPFTTTAPPLHEGRGFAGIQGQIWTETVRDAETLGYQVFPRLFALAERAWHRPAWEVGNRNDGASVSHGDPLVSAETLDEIDRDWNRFASILAAKELPKLEMGGWHYRLPVPGARLTRQGIKFNTAIPGLPVQCYAEGRWHDAAQCPASGAGTALLRTSNRSGTLHSRTVEVVPSAE